MIKRYNMHINKVPHPSEGIRESIVATNADSGIWYWYEDVDPIIKKVESLEAENKRLKDVINKANGYLSTASIHSNPRLMSEQLGFAIETLKEDD